MKTKFFIPFGSILAILLAAPSVLAGNNNQQQPNQNWPQQPNQNWPQQPNQNWPQQPNQNWPQQPNQNWPQQPAQNWPQQPNQNWPQQPPHNWPQQPNQNWPQQPNQNWPQQPNQNWPQQPPHNWPQQPAQNWPQQPNQNWPQQPPQNWPQQPNQQWQHQPTNWSPTFTPVSGGSAPTNGGSAPTNGGSAPTNGGSAPTTGGSAPTTGGSAPTTGGSAPTTGGSAPTTGGSAPVTAGSAKVRANANIQGTATTAAGSVIQKSNSEFWYLPNPVNPPAVNLQPGIYQYNGRSYLACPTESKSTWWSLYVIGAGSSHISDKLSPDCQMFLHAAERMDAIGGLQELFRYMDQATQIQFAVPAANSLLRILGAKEVEVQFHTPERGVPEYEIPCSNSSNSSSRTQIIIRKKVRGSN